VNIRKAAYVTMFLSGAALSAVIVNRFQFPMASRMSESFPWLSAIKWSSVIVAIGGAIYFVATKKLLHLEVIEVGEMGFRTSYGKPVLHRRGPKVGKPKVYYPGDRVVIIPIIVDIVVVSTRPRVMTIPAIKGVFKGKNISFDLDVRWQVLADEDSAFKAGFGLHEVVRDDEKIETLDDLIRNDIKVLADQQLDGLRADGNGLPDMTELRLYPPMLESLEEYGPIVNSVRAMERQVAPEERQKEGLLEAARSLADRAA
jgi:hypothetical protein